MREGDHKLEILGFVIMEQSSKLDTDLWKNTMRTGYVGQVAFAANKSPIRCYSRGRKSPVWILVLPLALLPVCPNQISSVLWASRFHLSNDHFTYCDLFTVGFREKKEYYAQRPGRNNNCLIEQWVTTGWASIHSCMKNKFPHTSVCWCILWVLNTSCFWTAWTTFLGVILCSLIGYRKENRAGI